MHQPHILLPLKAPSDFTNCKWDFGYFHWFHAHFSLNRLSAWKKSFVAQVIFLFLPIQANFVASPLLGPLPLTLKDPFSLGLFISLSSSLAKFIHGAKSLNQSCSSLLVPLVSLTKKQQWKDHLPTRGVQGYCSSAIGVNQLKRVQAECPKLSWNQLLISHQKQLNWIKCHSQQHQLWQVKQQQRPRVQPPPRPRQRQRQRQLRLQQQQQLPVLNVRQVN